MLCTNRSPIIGHAKLLHHCNDISPIPPITAAAFLKSPNGISSLIMPNSKSTTLGEPDTVCLIKIPELNHAIALLPFHLSLCPSSQHLIGLGAMTNTILIP